MLNVTDQESERKGYQTFENGNQQHSNFERIGKLGVHNQVNHQKFYLELPVNWFEFKEKPTRTFI